MSDTYLIVGLGNPGRRYEKTRHNAGFMVVDRLAAVLGAKFKKGRGVYEICDVRCNEASVLLAKPLTFMNNSGTAVAELVRYYQIDFSRLLVVLDEIELPFGRVRLRRQGNAGGHNGLSSIIQHLNTTSFARLRIGIGTEFAKRDMVDFVLSRFSRNEQEELDSVLATSVDAVLSFIRDGIDNAMNLYNQN
jgi:peptidyl-tRNA hydrolase, PTH1 family